jgi:hypothetical protein
VKELQDEDRTTSLQKTIAGLVPPDRFSDWPGVAHDSRRLWITAIIRRPAIPLRFRSRTMSRRFDNGLRGQLKMSMPSSRRGTGSNSASVHARPDAQGAPQALAKLEPDGRRHARTGIGDVATSPSVSPPAMRHRKHAFLKTARTNVTAYAGVGDERICRNSAQEAEFLRSYSKSALGR